MAKVRTSLERLEREIHRFLSRHHTPRSGEEAYDFDIKIHRRINIPDIVRHSKGWSEAELSDFVDDVMRERLMDFTEALEARYDWIEEWFPEGRSGGWLVLTTLEPVMDGYGHIPETEDPKAQRITVKAAEGRLKDLGEIEGLVERGIKDLVKDLESVKWWGISPKDWFPRKG